MKSSQQDPPTKAGKRKIWKDSLPFHADYKDHFETPKRAYADIAPLLDFLHSDRTEHVLYDPYFCNGRVRDILQELGYTKVIHECRDFYQDLRNKDIPEFDTLVTNPPYSDQHKERCLEFALKQLRVRQRPFFLLLPNYVAARQYYRGLLYGDESNEGKTGCDELLYILPSERYEFDHPEGTGHEVSPFDAIWYCGIGRGRVEEAVKHWNDTLVGAGPRLVTLRELQQMGAIPTTKRPNPRQRRKKRRRMTAADERRTHSPTDTANASGGAGTDMPVTRTKKSSRYRDKDGKRTRERF